MLQLLLLALTVILLGVAGIALYKVRKIHLATYGMSRDIAAIRRETDFLFRQLQALSALERKLHLEQPLPPLRGWAGSPDFLTVVAEEIECHKPLAVVECSSGVSTVVCARMLQLNGAGHVFSLEHDPNFAVATSRMLARYGLSSWATVLDAPLDTARTPTPWYSTAAIPQDIDIDLLIVDGPPEATASLARYPALPVLASRMSPHANVVVDDAAREGERQILARWLKEFPEFQQQFFDCEKGCAVLRR